MMAIGIKTMVDGKMTTVFHAPHVAGPDYHTMCSLEGDDPVIGTFGSVAAIPGQKITCPQCYGLWRGVVGLRLKESDFGEGCRR